MQLTVARTPSSRPLLYLLTLVLLVAAMTAAALYIGSQRRLPDPFGIAGNGAVVYERAGDLVIADEFGASERTLVGGPEREWAPIFSQQGDRIAYLVGEGGSGLRVMVVRADGGGARELAGPFRQVDRAEWASDGSALVIGHAERGFPTISVAAADGSGVRELDLGIPAEWVTWRPGTDQIAFRGQPGPGGDVVGMYLVRADGSGLRPLDLAGHGLRPWSFEGATWSPDGRQLAFGGEPHWTIVDVGPDGAVSSPRKLALVPGSVEEIIPAWSPDGSRIAFLFEKDGMRQLAIGPADLGAAASPVGPTRSAEAGGFGHAWSPDGRTLLVTFFANKGPQLFWSVDAASGETTEIARPTGDLPTWQRVAR